MAEVVVVNNEKKDPVATAVALKTAQLAMSFDNPKAIAEHLADWMKETLPSDVYTAYWVTITKEKERDKGIALEVLKLPYNLRIRLLLGARTGGFAATEDFKINTEQIHARVFVGLGAVTEYDKLGSLKPVAVFGIHF